MSVDATDGATRTGTERGADTDSLPVGPALLSAAVATGVLLPILWLFVAAFEVGLDDAVRLLTRSTTVRVFANSFAMVAAVTGLSVALALPLAYLTARTDMPFRRFWTVALALPLVIPSYIGAFAFVSAFGPRGELQSLLAPLGVETLPEVYGFGGAVLVLTLYTYPYVFITARAALTSLDGSLVDAARTLGHDRGATFQRVVLPQVRPAIAAGSLLVALYALSDFGTPAIMQFPVFTNVIYNSYNAFARDFAALLSLQLLGATLFLLAVESRLRGDDTLHGGGRSGRTADRVPLGEWTLPALAFCGGVVALALAVPIGILGLWLVEGDGTSAMSFRASYAANSVTVSGAAALVAALAGLPVAYLSAHHDSRLPALFERVSYLGYAVPGVVIGLAFVFFGARYANALYQTLPLLVFAYVVRFLPQSVGSTRASLLQVDPALPEVARTLGRSPFGAFRAVTLPLVAPGLLGGAALVFLTTMKELPATLMLRPAGYDTLVTHIWRAQLSGYFGDAAVPALVLVVASGLSMLLLLSLEEYDVK